MQKVGIIGTGNAGGQIASLAKRKYDVNGLAVNTSNDDVSTITNIDVICLGDEKGAGKDRVIAKNFLRDQIKELLTKEEFLSVINSSNVIFIVGSTGGGTGSAFAPVLTHVLSNYFPNKKFIPVGILPPIKESVAAQQNSIDYLKEVSELEATYMLYDNEKFSHMVRSELFSTMNMQIVEDIVTIRGDYQKTTPLTSIDERDSTKIIFTPGRLVVGRVEGIKEKDIDQMTIEKRLIEAVKKSAHAELDYDQIIKRFGLITNLSDKIHKSFDPSLPEFKDTFGEPIEEFEHIYVNQSNDEINRVAAIMSGLMMPDDRIEKIMQRIQEVEDLLSMKKTSVLSTLNTDGIKGLREDNVVPRKSSIDDLDGMFDKFM